MKLNKTQNFNFLTNHSLKRPESKRSLPTIQNQPASESQQVFKIKKIKVPRGQDNKSSNSDLHLPPDAISVRGAQRRNSYDGVIRGTPLDQDAFRNTKMTQIDQENKKIQRIMEQFENSEPKDRQEIIKEMLQQASTEKNAISPRILEEMRYDEKVETFLDNLAEGEFNAAAGALGARKSVKFKPQKPPLAKAKSDKNFGILRDLLQIASKDQHPTSNKKLLQFLQQKMLFEQKPQTAPSQQRKQMERDLNYLNVFVQPISQINIFSRDSEPKPPQEPEHLTFDEQLEQLLTKSPLKSVIDDRILHLSEKQASGSFQRQALSEVLEMLLAGPTIQKDIIAQIVPFMSTPEYEYAQEIDLKCSFEQNNAIFEMSKINKFRQQLQGLIAQEQKEELCGSQKDRVQTFLTEQFPPPYEEDEDEYQKFNVGSKVKEQLALAKKVTFEEETQQKLGVKTVRKEHAEKKRLIRGILTRIEKSENTIKQVSTEYVISQTERQKLLYLGFIECLRQIGQKNRHQALLCLKLWHEYFNLAQTEIKHIAAKINRQLTTITQEVKNTVNVFQEEQKKIKFRDIEVLQLKHDFTKTLDVLEVSTRNTYLKEQKLIEVQMNLDRLRDNLLLVYPNCLQYLLPIHPNQKEAAQEEGTTLKEVREQLEKQQKIVEQNNQVQEFQSQIIYKCGVTSSEAEKPRKKESIYDHVVEDLERVLRAIPAKINIQRDLDDARHEIKFLKSKIEVSDKNYETQTEEVRQLQERCTKLTGELVACQQKYDTDMEAMRSGHEVELKETRKRERLLIKQEQLKHSCEQEVQTEVGEQEEMLLRQREFSQRLTKYRGVNKNFRMPQMEYPKDREDQDPFLKGQPMIENVYGPIMGLMQVVRSGRSKLASEVKSAKNVLKFIAGLLQSKISAMDKSSNDVYGLMNIDCFFYNHVQHTYGLDALANKYCEIYLLSMDTHRKKDTRIELFLKFVGLDLDKLPYSIFEHYVTLIKATNISVTNLLNQPMHNQFIDYNRVRHTFKELLHQANELVHAETIKALKKYTRILTENKIIEKTLEIDDYEVYKDLTEQILRSRFKSSNNVIKAVFEHVHGEERDSEDEEAGPRTITLQQLKAFIQANFDLTDYSRGQLNLHASKTIRRMSRMLDIVFILGQSLDPQKLTMRDLAQGFREKLELRLPVAAFFHIGINACVDHENEQNAQYGKIYQFYTQVEITVHQETGDLFTQDVRVKLNLEGMDFQQFVLFLKDTGCKLVEGTKRQGAWEIYKSTCEQRARERMTCDDFVEAIRKYRLVVPMDIVEAAMKRREMEIATSIRANLVAQGLEVPDVLEKAVEELSEPTPRGGNAVEEEKAPLPRQVIPLTQMAPAHEARIKDLKALSGSQPARVDPAVYVEKVPQVVDKGDSIDIQTQGQPRVAIKEEETPEVSEVRQTADELPKEPPKKAAKPRDSASEEADEPDSDSDY